MSGTEAIAPHQRRKLVALVREHPGSTPEELKEHLSAHGRFLFGAVLRATRECCMVRVDESGRIWPTT